MNDRALPLGDLADRPVEALDPGPEAVGAERHGGTDVRVVGHEHRGAAGAQLADDGLEVVGAGVEIDLAAEDVVDPGDHAREVRLQRQRRLELLGPDLRQLAAADRQVRVESSGLTAASCSARRSAQPRKPLPSGRTSARPSVVESPRAT